jgi:tetratricopeptide (TPR) repeat protein
MVEAWVNLGGAHLLSWDFDKALDAIDRALELDPELLVAHYNRGQALLYLNRPEDMLQSFEKVVALDPEHGAGNYYLAVALLANGRVEEARKYASRASALGHRPRPEFLRELEKREKGAPPTPQDSDQQ